eukprot:g30008.t1
MSILEVVLLDILKHMNMDKSPGPDHAYPRALSEAREVIAGLHVEKFLSSISTGKEPEDWRLVNMAPLFKRGGKEKPGNYRPVSLTLVVGKLLKGILRDRIYMYLDRQRLIRDSQHGFVRGKSCHINLIELFEEVTKTIDEGRAVDIIYMDFRKASDKVPHGRLVRK